MAHARSTAFKSGNEMQYKTGKYGLRRVITATKRQYREKLDGYSSADCRSQNTGTTPASSAPQTACLMTSSASAPASRPPATSQGESLHLASPTPCLSSTNSFLSPGTQNPEEDQHLQGSRAGQHPCTGSQNMCQRTGRCSHLHLQPLPHPKHCPLLLQDHIHRPPSPRRAHPPV